MKKTFYFIVVITLLFLNLDLLYADDVEFRPLVVRNDSIVGGEFHVDLQVRMTSGSPPRTLSSMTVDVLTPGELTQIVTPAANWAFGFLDGYTRSANSLTGFYRVLVTGGNVNANANPTPPGDPAGWDVTASWQTICTLQWTINTATQCDIIIDDATDAAGYFDNYTNAPQGGVTDFVVSNQDTLDVSLPVELTSFTAHVTKDLDVTLKWVTETEVNNQGFKVFRSEEEEGTYDILSSYTSNNELVGQGNSSAKTTYAYTDNTAMKNNTYWYKIADVDYNGVKTFHGPISIVVESGNTAGGDDPNYIPDEFALSQNYPNPFNPKTKIKVSIPDVDDIGDITINVYDIMGKKVTNLFTGNMDPGVHTIQWNGLDGSGKQVSGGTYFYYLKSNKFHQIKKMILMK